MHALDDLLLSQVLGHTTYACCAKVVVSRLNAPQTAQPLVARLFPLGDQITICIALIQAKLIQLLRDGISSVIQIVDVSTFLVRNLEDRP